MIVRKKTSVHEKTVQKVAKGEIKTPKKRAVRRPANSKVDVQSIEPILKTWIEENNISPDRIQIVSATEIIVKNPRK
jgi:hypothetical protein